MTSTDIKVMARICGICGVIQLVPEEQLEATSLRCGNCSVTNKFKMVGEIATFPLVAKAGDEQGDKYRG